LFNLVRPVRGFEDIAAQVQDAIEKGELAPGDKLPNERDMATVFGVSRPTVREAIRVLEAANMVEVRRGVHGGVFILEPTAEHVGHALEALLRFQRASVLDLAEFRGSFESSTAFIAAQRAKPEQVERLKQIAVTYRRLVEEERPWSKLIQLDMDFHQEVANATQNQIRVAIMLGIQGVLRQVSLKLSDDKAWRDIQVNDVEAVVQAIVDRDPEKASSAMKEHVLRNIEAELRKYREEFPE